MPPKLLRQGALLLLALPALLAFSGPAEVHTGEDTASRVTPPEAYFGFRPGSDYKLADYHQIIAYFQQLDAASDRLQMQNLGKTTAGNDLHVAFISAPHNLAQLEHWQRVQARLADPRSLAEAEASALLAQARAVVLINCSIHATEVGATQMAPELAYDLVTDESPAGHALRENVITILLPCHNPDGQLLVVEWYRKNLGTPFERAELPWLYHKYAGHDNNRDWFMFTQKETRLTVGKLYNVWHPHITLDMHQMGGSGARLFVPPYLDPVEPNVDPAQVALGNLLGMHVQGVLTAQGKTGVVSNAIFDAWSPARAYPHYHAGVRLLTEVASAALASPVTIKPEELRAGPGYDARQRSWNFPAPWPGGVWRLRDIVEYDLAAARAALQHAAQHREFWLRSLYDVKRRTCQAAGAYVIPRQQFDPQGLLDLLDILQTGMVEIEQAQEDFQAGGATFAKGDYLVALGQPFGNFARALLERQEYPRIPGSDGKPRPPYDVTAHTLPLFLGVEVFAVEKMPDCRRTVAEVNRGVHLTGETQAGIFALDRRNTASYRVVNALLRQGVAVSTVTEEFVAGGRTWPAGTFLVERGKATGDMRQVLRSISPLNSAHGNSSIVELHGLVRRPALPHRRVLPNRIGLYRSWVANMDEGWTRWVLEDYGFAYTTLSNADLLAQDLRNSFEVIILPDQKASTLESGHDHSNMPAEYAGGLGELGIRKLRQFVDAGGTLITFASACELVLHHFWLQVTEVTAGVQEGRLNAPGSLLRVIADTDHFLGYGAPRESAVLFLNGPAFRCQKGRAVLTYPPHGLLLSGWLEGEEHLREQAALVEVPLGRGRVILFGFRPLFRGQMRATYRFLFNALLRH
ncbi:MAG: M14 family zinc carboxypeptidase [candidate division KSB1 bacterium]|nr:M14 family zinc carboxypeptidase [candidate division KSB1 bacterium]MDZ7408705.1 M14 family zinc carboxypeptidase [candidate division KSB1 bacterium]